ncbi:MAG: hypothetical protein ABEK01_04460 [Candidatus Nanohaloarchaea archaeon]
MTGRLPVFGNQKMARIKALGFLAVTIFTIGLVTDSFGTRIGWLYLATVLSLFGIITFSLTHRKFIQPSSRSDETQQN